jgi:hypothetical protein
LLAPVLGRRHTFREFLISRERHADLRGMDVVFCDSLATGMVRCKNKIHYRLVAPGCLDDLAAMARNRVRRFRKLLSEPNRVHTAESGSHGPDARARYDFRGRGRPRHTVTTGLALRRLSHTPGTGHHPR